MLLQEGRGGCLQLAVSQGPGDIKQGPRQGRRGDKAETTRN